MEQHQVVIVGAGPSGAACAKALIKAGIDVLILEKEKLPRNKICSGVLFGQTQVLLEQYFGGLPPQDVYCTPREIPAEYIREWNRDTGFVTYVWETGKDGQEFPQVYLNIWRSAFDRWLAEQSGAEVRQSCSARTMLQDGDMLRLTVSLREPGTSEAEAGKPAQQELGCAYLVGADGCGSTVRGFIDDPWRSNSGDVIIYQEYCHIAGTGSLRKGNWYVFFEPSVGDILCCVHRKDDLLTLCVGGLRGRDIRAGMAVFKQFLADRFQVALGDVYRSEGCAIRQLPPNLGSGRVLLAGEAAGFVYLNGEGISAAIDSGYRAGQAIAQAIKTGGDALDLYRNKTEDMMRHMDRCLKNMHFLVGQ
jgi:flavin-dependent dehydrogenase